VAVGGDAAALAFAVEVVVAIAGTAAAVGGLYVPRIEPEDRLESSIEEPPNSSSKRQFSTLSRNPG
jgi:hypothetical protein